MLRKCPLFREAADALQYDNSSSEHGRTASIPATLNSETSELSRIQKEKEGKPRVRASIKIAHTDIIKDDFWNQRPWLLSDHPDN